MAEIVYVIFAILTIFASYAAYIYMKNKRFWTIFNTFNGDRGLPIIGNGHQFGNNSVDILKSLVKMWTKYGKTTFRIKIASAGYVILSDPETIEVILSNNKEISKMDDYQFLKPWLGDGLLLADGNKWRRQRKIITPTFHFKILEQFLSVFHEKSNIFIKKLAENKGKVFDVYPYVTLCALDIICESAMGTCLNAQENESDYVRAVYKISEIIHHRTFSPVKRSPLLYPFSFDYWEERAARKVLHEMTNGVIRSRKLTLKDEIESKKMANGNAQSEEDLFNVQKKVAFLDLLLLSKTPEGESLSDESIREEVDTFMFEGHDTTTSAISFALYNLANNPKAQALAFEEQFALFGSDLTKSPSYADLQNMNYLDRVIKETLRIFPSVPFFGRKAIDDIHLPDGKIIPQGAYITLQIYCMNRNPKYFPDPLKFDPDRFLPENTRNMHPFLYVPFSAGPRNCIGQKFATLEMKSTISKVLRNFELLSGGPGSEPQLSAAIILKSENGVQIKIQDRKY